MFLPTSAEPDGSYKTSPGGSDQCFWEEKGIQRREPMICATLSQKKKKKKPRLWVYSLEKQSPFAAKSLGFQGRQTLRFLPRAVLQLVPPCPDIFSSTRAAKRTRTGRERKKEPRYQAGKVGEKKDSGVPGSKRRAPRLHGAGSAGRWPPPAPGEGSRLSKDTGVGSDPTYPGV